MVHWVLVGQLLKAYRLLKLKKKKKSIRQGDSGELPCIGLPAEFQHTVSTFF